MVYTDPEAVPRSALLAAVAAAVLVVAAFLPWSVEAAGSFGGLDDAVRDGYLTFGVGIGVVAGAVVLEWDWIARALAAAGGFVAVYVFSHWHGRLTGAEAADVGLGLWLTLAGGLGLLAAAAWRQFEGPGDDAGPVPGGVAGSDAGPDSRGESPHDGGSEPDDGSHPDDGSDAGAAVGAGGDDPAA